MNRRLVRCAFASASSIVFLLSACGGGGDDDSGSTPTPASTTTDITTKVVDGAIANALVCMDLNDNGICDAGEPQARSATSGVVTLTVANADVGQHVLLAMVGTDAVDADHGPVTVAYALATPADVFGLISPLTTLVQRSKAATGSSTTDAAKLVQDATGLPYSPLADYSTVAPPPTGQIDPATLARLIVVTMQAQATALAGTVGTMAIDGEVITQADLDEAIQKKLLELLPDLATALADPAVTAAATPADKEAALAAAATAIVADSGLTMDSAAIAVAINNQAASTTPVTPAAPAASLNLVVLGYTDASNYNMRVLTSSVAQSTPDAQNTTRYIDRRQRRSGGPVAKWGSGTDPARGADLHWNGTAWVGCPLNYANVSSVRDAGGNSSYEFCDKYETGVSNRAAFDVAGETLASIYTQIRDAGYTNLFIADPSVLGSAVFPADSKLLLQTTTPMTTAFAYYPGSPYSPGSSTISSYYTPDISAGGIAAQQPAGAQCNSPATSGNGINTLTLETLIASKTGTPCVYGQGSFVYQGVTYFSDPNNEWWGNSTGNIGVIGNAPVNSGPAPGYYTTNTVIRIAFKGTGTNPVTYYACRQRFIDGSSRNCVAIGSGSYTITTLGDARTLTLGNPPVQASALNYTRVFVERSGYVYLGYQNKPAVTSTARFNITGSTALLTALGLTPDDPAVPVELTANAYQGSWDLRSTIGDPTIGGTTVFLNANGTSSCQDRSNNTFYACSVVVTDPDTGAFDYSDATGTATGTFTYQSGDAVGTYNDPTSTPPTGSLIGHRR